MNPLQPENPAPIPTQEVKPSYQSPKVVTYTSQEILDQVGPAQACTISDGTGV